MRPRDEMTMMGGRPIKVFINRKIPIDKTENHKGYRLCLILIEERYWRARIMYNDIERFALHLLAGISLMDLTQPYDRDVDLEHEVKDYIYRQNFNDFSVGQEKRSASDRTLKNGFCSKFLKDSYDIISTYELMNS
jgi:hypothetical protein